jgi:Cu/Zn superoxide dismutase
MGPLPVAILEHFCVHARTVVSTKMRGELDRAVDEIIVLHESADESNDDDRRHSGAAGKGNRVGRIILLRGKKG